MNFNTRLIHGGVGRDPYTGASSIPIYQASTFDRRRAAHAAYDYARSGNPTREALEELMAGLDGGAGAAAFSSGMAAISSVFMLFRPGDHLLVSKDVYGGTFRVLETLFRSWGLTATFVDTSKGRAELTGALRPESKGVFVESPSNPLLAVTDLEMVASFAAEHGLMSIIDNSFSTPYLQRPLLLGFDLTLYSATKFLNGHSDVLAGLAVAGNKDLAGRLRFVQNAFGAVLGVQDSWLLLRGLKTLAVRMRASQEGALFLAGALRAHPKVRRVYYPGLEDHPGRKTHFRQCAGPGAVFSFELESEAAAARCMDLLELPLVGVSLGGVESILSYPAAMSHAAMPRAEREARGISGALLRFSVGLEDPEDLWADLRQALG